MPFKVFIMIAWFVFTANMFIGNTNMLSFGMMWFASAFLIRD